MTEITPPPHMNPMTSDEVNDLLSSTLHGDLPKHTMQRVFATLAAHNLVVANTRKMVLSEVLVALTPCLSEMDHDATDALGHVGVRSDRRADSIRAAIAELRDGRY